MEYPIDIISLVNTSAPYKEEYYFLEDGKTLDTKKAFEKSCFFKGAQSSWHKSYIISRLAELQGIDFFIETGTHTGDTLMTVSSNFKYNYSVEADEKLRILLNQRFMSPVRRNVKIFMGESPDVLPQIFQELDQHRSSIFDRDSRTITNRSIIFLDAHYSGESNFGHGEEDSYSGKYGKCPLLYELDEISKHHIKDHTIMIDDIRCMGTEGWPTTDEVIQKLRSINKDYDFFIERHADTLIAVTDLSLEGSD